jgi:flagellar basal body P-ring protein FlgI
LVNGKFDSVIILTGSEKHDSDYMSSIEMIFIDKDKICKIIFDKKNDEIVWKDDESDLNEESLHAK